MGAYALLIGISEFTDPRLAKLNAPKTDVEAFATVLKDPARGGFDNVTTCIDADLQTIRDQLTALLDDRKPDDMVLLYYSGHGIMTKGQRLFLATGQSSFDRPQARSLAAIEMRDMLEQSRAGKQVVILDCCHSGAFVEGSKGVAHTVTGDTFATEGAEGQYVLTATDALQFAYDAAGALRQSNPEPALSRFTGWLVDAIGKGEAAPDKDRITLDAVFDYLSRRARVEAAGMTPKRFVKRNSGEMVIAKNPLAQPPKLPDELIAQLDSKDWQARRDAVVQLGKLAEQANFRDLVERAVTDRVSLERDVDVRDAMLKLLRRFGSDNSVRIKPIPAAPVSGSEGMRASTQPGEPSPVIPWYRRTGVLFAGGVGLALTVFIVLGTIAGMRSYQRLAAIEKITQQQATDRAAAEQARQALEAEAARQREADAAAARQREADAAAARQREAEAAAARQRDAEAAAARQREAEAAAARQRDAEAAAARQRDAEAARAGFIEIQRQLTLAGVYSGPLDGTPGRATTAAIMAFQTRARLPATGKADDMTLARLKQISAAAAARQAGTDVASVTPGRAAAPDTARRQTHEPGSEFKDCAECPAMIALPPGSFTMGSPISESGRDRDEGPEHRVTIPNALAVGKYEVTFAEWDACVADGGCKGYQPPDEGWGRGNHPVVNVSWTDAQSYIQWLRNKTRQPYRLLSEAEWEYAARANTVSAYYWGARAGTTSARFNGSTIPVGSFAPARPSPASGTVPVGSYAPNSFGLYDMSGNVSEWAEDCLNRNYDGAPDNGSTWKTGNCDLRALRGGAWNSGSDNLRSANRDWDAIGFRVNRNGFRVARGL